MATIEFENASDLEAVPGPAQVQRWVDTTLRHTALGTDQELCVRIVDAEESQALNAQFRHQDKPTNVLSFPCELPPDVDVPLLGDLAICAPVVVREAEEQGKPPMAHWAHMVVHGTLHLCGYDHVDEGDALTMESLETTIMAALGFADPYQGDDDKAGLPTHLLES